MRDIIFVLGMHRSGTSAVTRICALLGAQLPKTLMEATESNPSGHWESDSIVNLNNKILEEGGTSWFDLPSWNSLRSIWQEFETSEIELLALLNSEYPDKKNNNSPIVLKDPRVSLLLPEYVSAVSSSKHFAETKAILCVRSPVEVAASLYERDGSEQNTSQMVWLVYMLYAERASRDIKRTVFHHSDLFSKRPYERFMSKTHSLNVEWPSDGNYAKKEIEDFITPKLYRQQSGNTNISIIPIVETVYLALLDLANDKNTKNAIRILDNCFDTINPILSADSIIRRSLHNELNDTQKALLLIEQEKNIIQANLEDYRQQFKKLQSISETRASNLTQASHKILSLEQSEANLKHSIGDIQSQTEQLKKHYSAELSQKLDELEEVRRSEAELKHSNGDIQSQMELLKKNYSEELSQKLDELEEVRRSEAELKHSNGDIQSQMELLKKHYSEELSQKLDELEEVRRSEAELKHSLADIKSQLSLHEESREIERLRRSAEHEQVKQSEADLKHALADIVAQMHLLEQNKNIELRQNRVAFDEVHLKQSTELRKLGENFKKEEERFLQQSLLLKETRVFADQQHAISDELNQKLETSLKTIDSMHASVFWKSKNIFDSVRGFPRFFLNKNLFQKRENARDNIKTEKPLIIENLREWLIENEGPNWKEENDKRCLANVDNISLSEGVMHLWGWGFHTHAETIRIDVLSLGWSGHVDVFTAESRKAREDVETAFGSLNSRMSGFSFLGSWGKQLNEMPREIALVIRLSGANDQLIPVKRLDHALDKNVYNRRPDFKKYLKWKLKHIFSLVRSGDFRSLAKGASRIINRGLSNKEKKSDEQDAVIQVTRALKNGAQFIIDHSLGGGCNSYTRDLTKKIFAEGRDVIIMSFSVHKLSPTIQVLLKNEDNYIYEISNGIRFLEKIATELSSIFLNNIVSFPKPEYFISSLSKIVENNNISLTIAFHDQYAICPSHFLLNSEGRFCNIPTPEVCVTCLDRNSFGFTSLAESGDVVVWRRQWNKLISVAEHLLFFSEASLALVRKAHPNMNQSAVNVKPHTIDVSNWDALVVPTSSPLKIGVVGSLSHHKGSEVIMNLAAEIQNKELDIEIYIIGELNSLKHPGITTTGPFNRGQLPSLIMASGANVFLMPSIVPETFSYVTAELMALGLPVVSFDFGAPAERLEKYKLGLTIPQGTSAEILDSILNFYEKLKKV